MFFPETYRTDIDGSEAIYIYGGDDEIRNVKVNLFGVFAGKEKDYSLSFSITTADSGYISWFDANAKCEEEYGTSLIRYDM